MSQQSSTPVALTGSDKQIAWAEKIRSEKIGRGGFSAEDLVALSAQTAASWWIDRRDRHGAELVKLARQAVRQSPVSGRCVVQTLDVVDGRATYVVLDNWGHGGAEHGRFTASAKGAKADDAALELAEDRADELNAAWWR